MTSLARDIARYERWLRTQCDVVDADLDAKHQRMRRSAFDFLRATYFRWARTIEASCPGLGDAPRVLCVGDIHIENFGTWRDAESRQVWGVNDFDEAAVMPYAFDLVRLVTSARLAPDLAVGAESAAEAVLHGYLGALRQPRPLLLDHGPAWFRELVHHLNDSVGAFWDEVDRYPDAAPSRELKRALRNALPRGARIVRFATRRKGGGSLGRPRFIAVADWMGGRLVREAKAVVPSAWDWARAKPGRNLRFMGMAFGPYRAPDPTLSVAQQFLLRRVAPDAQKLEAAEVARQGLAESLLGAMGADLGSIHAAHHRATLIQLDLSKRGKGWLHRAASEAQQAVEADFQTLLGTPPDL